MSLVELMRQDWDERARRNAFHYIASWQEEWDLDAFLASGEYDYDTLVAPVLDRCGIPKSGERMLELGCGAGRMTRSFASRYRRVLAVDLSAEMLSRARKIHSSLENISWLCVGGADLACLASGSVDFVFSYLVLQHLPTRALVKQYIQEMLRVLRSGGAFMFQFNGSTAPTMNLRGRIAWHLVDALWSARLPSASRVVAAMVGFDPAAAGKSWRGAAIESCLVLRVVHDASGIVLETSGQGTPMTWCCGVKSGLEPAGDPDDRESPKRFGAVSPQYTIGAILLNEDRRVGVAGRLTLLLRLISFEAAAAGEPCYRLLVLS